MHKTQLSGVDLAADGAEVHVLQGNSNFNFMSSSVGSTYISTLNANATGTQYLRFGVDWGGTTGQFTRTIGSDVSTQANYKYALTSSCATSGSITLNVTSTSDNYVFKTLDAGSSPSHQFVIFQIAGAIQTVSSVSQSPTSASTIYATQPVIVSATLSGSLAAGQSEYIRYTTDNWTSSTIVKMTGTGTSYTGVIPGQPGSTNVAYYVFSSGSTTIAAADADLFTINLNNNGGSNYSYSVSSTIQNNIASGGACDGSWDDADCWDGGILPGNKQTVYLSNNASIDAGAVAYIGDLTIPTGVTLSFGSAASRLDINNLRVANVNTTSVLLLDGAVSSNLGKIFFSDGGTLNKTSGTIEVNELEVSHTGGGATLTVNNPLKVNGMLGTNASGAINMTSKAVEITGTGNIRTGSLPFTNLGLVTFTGSGTAYITGGAEFANGLTINKPSGNVEITYWYQGPFRRGVTMSGSALTLTSGILDGTGTVSGWKGNVVISPTASISGGSSSSYINAPLVIQNIPANHSGNVLFPVGKSISYMPVILNNTGTNDTFTVEVGNYITADGTFGGTAVTSNAVSGTWNVSEATTGGSNVSLSIQWNGTDELTGFPARRVANDVYVSHYTGGAWSPAAAGAVSGTDPYTLAMTGITSFSTFGIGGGGAL